MYIATDPQKTAPPNDQQITSEKTSILIRYLEKSKRNRAVISSSVPSRDSLGGISSSASSTSSILGKRTAQDMALLSGGAVESAISSGDTSGTIASSMGIGIGGGGGGSSTAAVSASPAAALIQAHTMDESPRPRKQRRSNFGGSIINGSSSSSIGSGDGGNIAT